MPTGWTAGGGTDDWVDMPVSTDHSADVKTYAINWAWSGADTVVVGDGNGSGNGKFGFTVFKNIAGSQSIGIDENATFNAKIRYRVIVTNPTNIADWSLPRLALELYCLGHATSNPLPRMGSKWWETGVFGTISGASTFDQPYVRGIQMEPESEKDPSVWIITYTVTPDRSQPTKTRPGTGAKSVQTTEEAPWLLGPDVSINFGTEDFVLGLGKYIGAKTPTELDTELQNGTYAASFGATGGTFEMVANSAGDPLESPPPMKVGTATIQITRAFDPEDYPPSLAESIRAANEEVLSSALTINDCEFYAYSCKLSGAAIVNKRWKTKADWLPKQVHPLGASYKDIGWLPPKGVLETAEAVNFTKQVLPAFKYVDYVEVSITIAQRDLGWGYALVDKGYRDKNKDENSFEGRQSHLGVLAEGLFVDMNTGTTDKKVLRLYQVHKVGANLAAVVTAMGLVQPPPT